jgi:hypothetical protein
VLPHAQLSTDFRVSTSVSKARIWGLPGACLVDLLTLLCLSSGHGGVECSVELAGDVALEAAADLAWGLAFGGAAVDVGAGSGAVADPGQGDGVDDAVECPVAAGSEQPADGNAAREKTALRIIALSVFALAVYLTADAVRALTGTGGARHPIPGIVLAALALAVMPVLSVAQRQAGRKLSSSSAVADSKQILLCAASLSEQCSPACSPTPCLVGPGLTRSPRRPSPRWRPRKIAMRGAGCLLHSPDRLGPPGRRSGCVACRPGCDCCR